MPQDGTVRDFETTRSDLWRLAFLFRVTLFKRAGLFDYIEEATRRRSDALLIIIGKYISIPIFKMGRRSQREIGHRCRKLAIG
jgi:hypothetical protein